MARVPRTGIELRLCVRYAEIGQSDPFPPSDGPRYEPFCVDSRRCFWCF